VSGLLICKGYAGRKGLLSGKIYLKPVNGTYKLLMLYMVLYLNQYPYDVDYTGFWSQILSYRKIRKESLG